MSCEQCTQGYVLTGEPTGAMVDGAYFRAGPEGADPSKAIVILTDVFGLPLKNCKLIADELSKRVKCDVWVPDLFAGAPPVTVDELEPLMPYRPGQTMPFTTKLRVFWLLLTRGFKLFGLRAAVIDPRVTEFVTKIRKEKGYTRVGAAGYCLGGTIAIRLGATDLFDSLVILHPGNTTIEQIKAIKKPAAWACAEEDMSFKKPLRDEAEALFASRKDKPEFVEYEFKDYKGTCHGFAARPNLEVPEIVEAYHGALDQTAAWFEKTL
ncbi:dienelactone hydrolase family protein [Phanerochaete sordida]|uniref:Dienelactone hydrolase family protein n=1 Tax=Phanerochaete sordida TaxID=48140 RepID=A0A9P3GBF1_9APHY|nr:dienelactone hydrolase family protein [Phanerochaete sordida]